MMSETSQIHNYTEKETVINYLVVSSLSRFYTELSFQNRIIASLAGSPVLFLYPRNLRNAKDPFFHERLTSSTSGHFCLIFFSSCLAHLPQLALTIQRYQVVYRSTKRRGGLFTRSVLSSNGSRWRKEEPYVHFAEEFHLFLFPFLFFTFP